MYRLTQFRTCALTTQRISNVMRESCFSVKTRVADNLRARKIYTLCNWKELNRRNDTLTRINDEGDNQFHIVATTDEDQIEEIIKEADPFFVVHVMYTQNNKGTRPIDLVSQPLQDRIEEIDRQIGLKPFRHLHGLRYMCLTEAHDYNDHALNFSLRVFTEEYTCEGQDVSLLAYATYIGMGYGNRHEKNIVAALKDKGFSSKGINHLKRLSMKKKNEVIIKAASFEHASKCFEVDKISDIE